MTAMSRTPKSSSMLSMQRRPLEKLVIALYGAACGPILAFSTFSATTLSVSSEAQPTSDVAISATRL